jgi:hypothetical protein
MEPNAREIESRLVCNLIAYLFPKIGKHIPKSVQIGLSDSYGNAVCLNEHTAVLCDVCQKLPEDQSEKLIYNAHDADARKLATWWDHHQEADRQRLADEAAAAKKQQLQKQALAKLTPEEIEALTGIKYSDFQQIVQKHFKKK